MKPECMEIILKFNYVAQWLESAGRWAIEGKRVEPELAIDMARRELSTPSVRHYLGEEIVGFFEVGLEEITPELGGGALAKKLQDIRLITFDSAMHRTCDCEAGKVTVEVEK